MIIIDDDGIDGGGHANVITGCDAACKLLIEAKADVAATDKDGLTGKRSCDPVCSRIIPAAKDLPDEHQRIKVTLPLRLLLIFQQCV